MKGGIFLKYRGLRKDARKNNAILFLCKTTTKKISYALICAYKYV